MKEQVDVKMFGLNLLLHILKLKLKPNFFRPNLGQEEINFATNIRAKIRCRRCRIDQMQKFFKHLFSQQFYAKVKE